MAEFCLDCWNELNGCNSREGDVTLSFGLDFCEGCGEWKPVVISLRPEPFWHQILRKIISR